MMFRWLVRLYVTYWMDRHDKGMAKHVQQFGHSHTFTGYDETKATASAQRARKRDQQRRKIEAGPGRSKKKPGQIVDLATRRQGR